MFVIVPALVGWYHRTRKQQATPRRPTSAPRQGPIDRDEDVADRHATSVGVQRLIQQRPITSFLMMSYVGLWSLLAPVLLLDAPYRLFSALGALVGLAVPAVLVTWACEGSEGVAELGRRALQWRVRPRWHAFALLAIPCTAVLLARLLLGDPPAAILSLNTLQVAAVFLLNVLVAVVTVQLSEELAWTGLVQHRLQRRHGAMRASLLIAPAFALIHLPTYFIGAPVTAENTLKVLVQMVVIIIFAVFFRAMIAWVYNVTAFSILLAAILHASFNTASGTTFVEHLSPTGTADSTAAMIPLLAVVGIACLVGLVSRGRLGLPQYEQTPERVPSNQGALKEQT